jgi:quercetin dioxygenase-like cupin family protein
MSTAFVAPARVETLLQCVDLDATVTFFVEHIGFRLDSVFPADDPGAALLSGHGTHLRIVRSGALDSCVLRLLTAAHHIDADSRVLTAPNGTRVEIAVADRDEPLPALQQKFSLVRAPAAHSWGLGRAGMLYRDLIPEREGGRFIASHIRIPHAGPVPDYVHYHKVRFQMIYCYKGWVRVVYEDQGEPFVMHAGDCVLQPPRIRHRVLEASAGLEVVEIGCPAEHITSVEHHFDLPTPVLRPQREFAGQQFVRHLRANALWEPWVVDGFEARELGIRAATRGLATARVARVTGIVGTELHSHGGEFQFLFVLSGTVTMLDNSAESYDLSAGDALTIPADFCYRFVNPSDDLEVLDVALP